MIRSLIATFMMCAIGLYANGQTYLVNQGAIIVTPGSSMLIDGDFSNAGDGSMNNSGTVILAGDWTNNASSGNLLQGTTGTVTFAGSTSQTIGGTAKTWFSNLELQNSVSLSTETSVSGDLSLSSSYIALGTNDLVMESGSTISGAGPLAYVIAKNSGQLIRTVGPTSTTFPVGTATTFAPFELVNAGTSDDYGVNLFEDVREDGLTGVTIAEIEDCVGVTWNITEENPGGSDLTATAHWNVENEGTTFDRTHAGMGHYTASAWDPQEEVIADGTGPYSITRSGITTLSPFAVGDLESPMAFPLVVRLDVSAFLEGPFNGSGMDNALNTAGQIPSIQPYSSDPWNYPGDENVGTLPTDMIDWVLIELRDASSAANATSATIIGQKAALLLEDGSVVDVDGVSNVVFDLNPDKFLFVVVWHRNHLGIMSANPLVKTDGIYAYDFTTAAGQAYLSGQKNLSGAYGMYGGDGKPDSFVDAADKTEVWELEAGISGYLQGDYTLDGQVNNPDKNDVWVGNDAVNSTVPN